MKELNKITVFNDGFSVSIQASSTHYCTPRYDVGPYTEVELGYPNQVEELLLPYAETPENPCMTVYGYVPVSVIHELIKKHGGICENNLPDIL